MTELIKGSSPDAIPDVRIDLPPGFAEEPVVGGPDVENSVRLFGRFEVGAERVPATFSLAVVELVPQELVDDGERASDPRVVAEALRMRYRSRRPNADARVVQLAIGPALAATTAGEYRLPPEMRGHPFEEVRPVYRVEVQIPAPDGRHVVLVDVTTEREAGWTTITEETVRIANSIHLSRE
ncbi:hypothetical protein B0I33_102341 [Prauserella shujinwangii]|uniref:Lipoprotein LpqN n=1 Tax=Prauserella shujinwangii TaxID=1453103 RepID=A0A2T0M0V3_9PSEU|nr:hypothetical protein [Prauserella shujinwangii]PRX50222.1 hypothetical protein B0I33_102341 [Prauserella shujinwangii]